MTSSKVPFCIDFIKVSMREMASTARCEDAFSLLSFAATVMSSLRDVMRLVSFVYAKVRGEKEERTSKRSIKRLSR